MPSSHETDQMIRPILQLGASTGWQKCFKVVQRMWHTTYMSLSL